MTNKTVGMFENLRCDRTWENVWNRSQPAITTDVWLKEIKRTIKKFKTRKTLGNDNITLTLMKIIPEEVIGYFVTLMVFLNP